MSFQLTAARRRLDQNALFALYCLPISTHSRAKAAGSECPVCSLLSAYFNSQPREGGWLRVFHAADITVRFQLTAARRRLAILRLAHHTTIGISTHSRAKAAGRHHSQSPIRHRISTHSRAKAAGSNQQSPLQAAAISTHSRAKAAGGTTIDSAIKY